MPETLNDATGNIRRFGIYFYFSAAGRNDKIKVFHWNGAKQYLFSDNERSHEARPVRKGDLDWTDIVTNVPPPIGCSHFALLNGLKTELQDHVLRQTQVHSTCIDKSCRLKGC